MGGQVSGELLSEGQRTLQMEAQMEAQIQSWTEQPPKEQSLKEQ